MQSLTTGTTAPPSWIHAWLPDTSSCRSLIICNLKGTNYFSSHSRSHTTGTVATTVRWIHILHDFDTHWIDGRHFQLLHCMHELISCFRQLKMQSGTEFSLYSLENIPTASTDQAPPIATLMGIASLLQIATQLEDAKFENGGDDTDGFELFF